MRWSDVEPVLRATYGLLVDRDWVSSDEVIAALDPPPADAFIAGRALRYLRDFGFIDGKMFVGHEMPERRRMGLPMASRSERSL